MSTLKGIYTVEAYTPPPDPQRPSGSVEFVTLHEFSQGGVGSVWKIQNPTVNKLAPLADAGPMGKKIWELDLEVACSLKAGQATTKGGVASGLTITLVAVNAKPVEQVMQLSQAAPQQKGSQ